MPLQSLQKMKQNKVIYLSSTNPSLPNVLQKYTSQLATQFHQELGSIDLITSC